MGAVLGARRAGVNHLALPPICLVSPYPRLFSVQQFRQHGRIRHVGYLAAVLTQVQDAILCLNPQGEIVVWNPAAERLFGYSRPEAVGRQAEIIVPASSRSEYMAMLEAPRPGVRSIRRELLCCVRMARWWKWR
jgi:PAS domain S-box-containing protein